MDFDRNADQSSGEEHRRDESDLADELLERNCEILTDQYLGQARQTPDQRLFGLIASPQAPIARTFLEIAVQKTPALRNRPIEDMSDLVGVMSYTLLRQIILKEAPRLLDWLPDPDPEIIPVLLATPGGYKLAGIPIGSGELDA